MPRENVEIVREVYAAAARRDRAAVFALYDEEVELDLSRIPLATLAGQGIYRGHDGLRSMFRDWYASFERYDEGLDEIIDAGKHIITGVTGQGRGRTSGAAVEMEFHLLWTIREGKVIRLVWFPTLAEALEAVGVSGS
jgi:ketosteroid isomerase-like protein